MYKLPSTLSKKKMSFGVGRRSVVENYKGKDSPPPTCYNTTKYSSFNMTSDSSFNLIKYLIPSGNPKKAVKAVIKFTKP